MARDHSEPFISKTEWITDQLREMILSGELVPGASLRQRHLAERFGVSPTPVREALQRLEVEGFVTGEVHRSVTVVRTEISRLYENALIRAALESLAARLAAERISAERLGDLRELAAAFEDQPQDSDAATELNRELHFTIYEAADSPMLYRLLQSLWQTLRLGPQVYRSHEKSVEDHAVIIDALAARDADRAAEITHRHIVESAELMLAKAASQASA